jgi:hypothetical protein
MAQKPKANSRNKGAAFEREIAGRLFGLTGVSFKRDIEQYRAADHGDLIPDDPAFPFVVECKRYAAGKACKPAWRAQASKAARAVNKLPCVVYKFNHADIWVSVPFAAFTAAFGGRDNPDEWAETTIEGLAFLASEIMAARA